MGMYDGGSFDGTAKLRLAEREISISLVFMDMRMPIDRRIIDHHFRIRGAHCGDSNTAGKLACRSSLLDNLCVGDVPAVMTLRSLATCETEKEALIEGKLRAGRTSHNGSNKRRIEIAPRQRRYQEKHRSHASWPADPGAGA